MQDLNRMCFICKETWGTHRTDAACPVRDGLQPQRIVGHHIVDRFFDSGFSKADWDEKIQQGYDDYIELWVNGVHPTRPLPRKLVSAYYLGWDRAKDEACT